MLLTSLGPAGRSGESDIQEMGGITKCVFNPNIPYAIFSSFLTFWLPMTCMILVYYRVYRYRFWYRDKVPVWLSFVPNRKGGSEAEECDGNDNKHPPSPIKRRLQVQMNASYLSCIGRASVGHWQDIGRALVRHC